MAQNFLTSSRHGSVFYFRRRVPDDLRLLVGKSYLVKSLATTCRGIAIAHARKYAVRTDALFDQLRAMKNAKDDGFQFNYIFEVDLDDLGFLRKIKVDATPDETVAVEAAIKATLQNIPARSDTLKAPPLKQQQISAQELFDHFYREGVGSGRWKSPETTRSRDYGPIWARFAPHVEHHGLTLAAAKEYRAAVLNSEASPETKHRNLYRVHAVVAYGVDHQGLDARMLKELKMPQAKGRGKNKRAKPYLPFTQDELVLLFHSDAYRQNSFKKPSHYWMPMLGLYTGARLEELAGLHLSVFSEVDGIPAVVLSDEATTDGGKNEHALRQVPLHPELIKSGLLQYVEQLRTEGHTRLFPEIREAVRDGYLRQC